VAIKAKKQWLIRDQSGKTSGPYTSEAMEGLISRGLLNGDEIISIPPRGEWIPIASYPEFYDLIMTNLENGKADAVTKNIEKMEAKTIVVTKPQYPKSRVLGTVSGDETKQADPSQFLDLTKSLRSGFSNLLKGANPQSPFETDNLKQASQNSRHSLNKDSFVPLDNKIPTITTNGWIDKIRLSLPIKLQKINLEFWLPRIAAPVLFLIGLSIYYIIDMNNSIPSMEGKIRLLAPGSQNGYLTPDESKAYLMKVKSSFERDNTSDWIEAQNILIKMAEAEPTNTEVRELLCMTHKELWQYAFQDAEDLQVLTHMTQTTRALNPSVRHGKTCEMIRTWLTGKFQEAKSQLEILLQEYPNISFYIWLKTDMLISENDFINGQGFASSLNTIWPEFNRGKLLSAQANLGVGRYQEARESLRKILSQNPDHKVAKLLLGEIEYKYFQQDEKAFELLMSGINSDELAPRQINVMAYTNLAILSEKRGDLKAARKYAERGFNLNPTNETLREMVKKLGGNDKNFNEAARTQELVAMGDQFVRSGDCLAAQAQYRAAFDLNPKQPVAAVKAAKCLYKVNQIFQAFEYLKRAIKGNPEYFPAYTLLADYYSQKFDFSSAMGVLNQARTYSTEAYEIYKGFALVELRKNNFIGALGYINRVISIYSTDPEAYVIMTRAYLGNGQNKEAFQSAQKAIEIDPINVEGQIAYGQALGALQGDSTGVEYLKKLVTSNKFVLEYKLALANALKDMERYSESLTYFEELVAADPKSKKAQIGMGESLNGIGKVEAALSAFLLAATFDPTDPEPVIKAGLLYLDTSRLDPAIQQFERALVINKNYPKAYYYIGKAAFLKGDLQKALDAALAERRANPNIVESYLLAAEIYMETRKYNQCTVEYQQAIKVRPQGADNYVRLARCYRLSGSYDIAQSMLDIAAEKESGYAEIYKERGALYQIQGDKDAAFKSYEKYLALSPNAPDKNEIEALMSHITIR